MTIPLHRWRTLALTGAVLLGSACATVEAPRRYAMPADLSRARTPEQAAPDSAAELAEAALGLLDPARPGGADLAGAAQLCLLASEVADPQIERELRRACFRTSARSALRSGDRDLYTDVVARWEEAASRSELVAGELVVHRAIRDRLVGNPSSSRVPPELRSWLREAEARP
jgi:hypothetical protein